MPRVRFVASKICRSFAAVSPMNRVISASRRTWKKRQAEFAGEDEGRQGFARAPRADQKELAPWREPLLQNVGRLPLLPDHSRDLVGERWIEDQLGQPRVGLRHLKEVREFSSRLADRDEGGSPPATFRFVDRLAQLRSELAVAQPGFVGSHLHGDRQEAVPAGAALRRLRVPHAQVLVPRAARGGQGGTPGQGPEPALRGDQPAAPQGVREATVRDAVLRARGHGEPHQWNGPPRPLRKASTGQNCVANSTIQETE